MTSTKLGAFGVRLCATAAMAAAMALAGANAAQASQAGAVNNYNFAFDASRLGCGVFGQSVICLEGQNIATPIASAVGDQFNIHVTSAAPIAVPGSKTQSLLFVSAYDGSGTVGPGVPGGVFTTYVATTTGFSAPGAPPPIGVGVSQQSDNRSHDYIGYVGYCCNYGVPDQGFSLTGVNMNLTVKTADPRSIVGYSVGYVYQLDALPTTLNDLPGGTADHAVLLPNGLINKINGSIGGPGLPAEQFYDFNWGGGFFQVNASVDGAASDASFSFELFNPDGTLNATFDLNNANGFTHLFTETGLGRGLYEVGLVAHGAADPHFTFNFDTPIGSAAPEPNAWAMLLLGFGAIGAAVRRRRAAIA